MRTNLLLDTNVVIYALQGRQHIVSLIEEEKLHLSFVSEIELLSWPGMSREDLALITKFNKKCTVIEYSVGLKGIVIDFRKRYLLKMADAFIAASAYQFEMLLVSADNVFLRVKEIEFFQIKP